MRELRITMLQPLAALRMMTAPYVIAGKAQSSGRAGAAAAAPGAAEEWGREPAWHAATAADQWPSGHPQHSLSEMPGD